MKEHRRYFYPEDSQLDTISLITKIATWIIVWAAFIFICCYLSLFINIYLVILIGVIASAFILFLGYTISAVFMWMANIEIYHDKRLEIEEKKLNLVDEESK